VYVSVIEQQIKKLNSANEILI